MFYSREYLKKFDNPGEFGTEEFHRVTQELITKIQSGEKLSLAEEDYTCAALELLMTNDPSSKNDTPQVFDYCKNFWFKNRYFLYFNNIECVGEVFYYKNFVSTEQKTKDREYLEKEYQKWAEIISKPISGDKILQYLSTETQHQLKEIERYCKNVKIGSPREEYLKKSIILHSKFIYLIVREFYQENGKDEERIYFFGKTVIIDSYSYIHILFRHYSASIKQHQPDKSYHYDENIDYKNLPDFLKDVIDKFKVNFTEEDFDRNRIYFDFGKTTYAIWFRVINISKPGNVNEIFLRLQTFYPVKKESESATIKEFKKVKIEPSIAFLIKLKE